MSSFIEISVFFEERFWFFLVLEIAFEFQRFHQTFHQRRGEFLWITKSQNAPLAASRLKPLWAA
jgi:hypothetical protein